MLGSVPLLSAFGSHYLNHPHQTSFAFHHFENDVLLFSDSDGTNITELTLNKDLVLEVRGLDKEQELITLTANNPYTNYTFDIEVSFTKTHDSTEERVLWIVIVVVGAVMILGLLMACARQKKRLASMKQQ